MVPDEGKILSNDLDPLVSKAGASLGHIWYYSLSFFPEAPFICLANDFKVYYTLWWHWMSVTICWKWATSFSVYVMWYLKAKCVSSLILKVSVNCLSALMTYCHSNTITRFPCSTVMEKLQKYRGRFYLFCCVALHNITFHFLAIAHTLNWPVAFDGSNTER